jgi:hypothetical protein
MGHEANINKTTSLPKKVNILQDIDKLVGNCISLVQALLSISPVNAVVSNHHVVEGIANQCGLILSNNVTFFNI